MLLHKSFAYQDSPVAHQSIIQEIVGNHEYRLSEQPKFASDTYVIVLHLGIQTHSCSRQVSECH